MKKENTLIQHFKDPALKKPSRRGGRPSEKTSRKHIISTRLTWIEMQSVEKALAKTGLNRSEALRLVLMHCVGHEQLPQKIYGGLSTNSGEIYLALSRVRKLLGQMEVNLPKQYVNLTVEEIFAGYSNTASKLGRVVQGIADAVIGVAPEKDQ